VAETIRFHLDENTPQAIALGLRRLGIDVSLPRDVGLLGASDAEHLAFAHRECRVVFTHDEDLLALHASGTPHSGIVYGHQEACSIGDVIRSLKLIWAIYEPSEMVGRVEYV